jgi:hypothetical protein
VKLLTICNTNASIFIQRQANQRIGWFPGTFQIKNFDTQGPRNGIAHLANGLNKILSYQGHHKLLMDSGHSSRPKKSGLTPTQLMPRLALSYFKGKILPKAISPYFFHPVIA